MMLVLMLGAQALVMPPARVHHRLRMSDSDAPVTAGGFNTAGEPPIEIRGFSLAKSFFGVGTVITLASFAEYFGSGQAGLSSLGFIYGIPILLVGLSLQYAELEPVAIEYVGDEGKLEQLWDSKATATLKKIRQDVTRHRYGDEAHLDTTVKALGLVRPGKDYPQLRYLQLSENDGELGFAMIFQSPDTPFNDWKDEKRILKYNTFFGPNVDSKVVKVDGENKLVAIALTTLPE